MFSATEATASRLRQTKHPELLPTPHPNRFYPDLHASHPRKQREMACDFLTVRLEPLLPHSRALACPWHSGETEAGGLGGSELTLAINRGSSSFYPKPLLRRGFLSALHAWGQCPSAPASPHSPKLLRRGEQGIQIGIKTC